MSTFEDYMSTETLHTEFIDGAEVMNSPSRRHVRVARRLTRLLEDACPRGYEVLPEFGFLAAPRTVLEPDIMVAAENSPSVDYLTVPPVLVVEVTSRSTKAMDWGRKRDLYEKAGVPWYWVVEPDDQLFWVIQRGHNRELMPGGVQALDHPFAVRLDLDQLFA